MNRILTIFLYFCLIILSNTCQQKKPEVVRVILLGLDGFSVEGFQRASHPNIDSLFSDGVISLNTRTVMPSVTMPNWTSHLTGAGPEQHGVFDNNWEKEKHSLDPQELDSEGYFPSIFKQVKEKVPGIKTAFFYNWANLIKPFNQKYLDKIKYEENDGFEKNYQEAFEFIKENKNTSTLTFLYSVHIDHAGHSYKWLSPEYISAIENADNIIGKFVEKLKNEGIYEDTHFLLFTDHGGVGNGHGGTSVAEMEVPWMIKGPKIQKDFNLNTPNSNTNTSIVVAQLFDISELPQSWIGKTPLGIFSQE